MLKYENVKEQKIQILFGGAKISSLAEFLKSFSRISKKSLFLSADSAVCKSKPAIGFQ